MRRKLGISAAHREGRLDQEYLMRLDGDVVAARSTGTLDAVVVFPHEHVYQDNGEPHPSAQELYVPNEYAFSVCERPWPRGRMLPAMSVHPYRADALDETERWIERGAVALKWLPNSQNINPRDPRCRKVFDLLARHDIPLIAHTGGEHTVRIFRPDLGGPALLQPALDRGVRVIAAHCGTKSGLFDQHWLPEFIDLARRHPNFYGDTSAFCTPGRLRWLRPLLREEGLSAKLVHGSDYPVPPMAWSVVHRLGLRRTCALQRTWSFLERDIRIKRAIGMPEEVFTNAAAILRPGSLERWGLLSSSRKAG